MPRGESPRSAARVRIRELERSLGLKLFKRDGRHARLTSDGRLLLGYAESLIKLAEDLESRVSKRGSLNGVLRIGAPDSFATVCLPQLVRDLEIGHPNLELEITVDVSAGLAIRLDRDELDLAIVMDAAVDRRVTLETLGVLDHQWVSSADLALPRKASQPGDLSEHRIITNPSPSRLYALIHEWFGNAGLRPQRICTCNSLNAVARLTQEGLGISVLPVPIVRDELQRGDLRIVRANPNLPTIIVYAAYHKSRIPGGVGMILQAIKRILSDTRFLVDLER
jgi:DNA-binding transcriptional LysR family regulator